MMNIKQINNYPELRTDQSMDIIINYMNTGLPIGIPLNKQQLMFDRYGPNGDFIVQNNELFYGLGNNLVLVVKPSQIDDKIEEIYNNPELGVGVGLSQFYTVVSRRFLNIKKKDTDIFLKTRGDYQISREPRRTINKPIITKTSNERWAVDLIDMSYYNIPGINGNRKYIFSCVDLYSNKVWARAISNRNNNNDHPTLSDAFLSICHEAACMPAQLQCDSEFAQGDFREVVRQHHIKLIKTPSYTPQSNGKIERTNRMIRQKLRAFFIRNNNLRWVAHLQTAINNINNQKPIRKAQTPNELWTPGYIRPNNNQPPNHLYNLVQLRAPKNPEIIYNMDDLVRVKLSALETKVRKRIKGIMENQKTAISYTPTIYKIFRVYLGNAHVKRSYALVKPHINNIQNTPGMIDEPIMVNDVNHNNYYKRFYGSDLIKIGTNIINEINHTNVAPKTIERALTINRIR